MVLVLLVDMDHAVEEGPEQDIGEHLSEEPAGEKRLPGPKELLPLTASLPQDHQPQHHHTHGVEGKPIQGGQA